MQFNDIPQEVQDHLIEIGDVMYTCGGITIENPEFQQCIKRMDAYDSVCFSMDWDVDYGYPFADGPRRHSVCHFSCLKTNTWTQNKRHRVNQLFSNF